MIDADPLTKAAAKAVGELGRKADFRYENQRRFLSLEKWRDRLQIDLCLPRTRDAMQQRFAIACHRLNDAECLSLVGAQRLSLVALSRGVTADA